MTLLLLTLALTVPTSYLVIMAYAIGLTRSEKQKQRLFRDLKKPHHHTVIAEGLIVTLEHCEKKMDRRKCPTCGRRVRNVDVYTSHHYKASMPFLKEETQVWVASSDDKLALALYGIFRLTYWLVQKRSTRWVRQRDLRFLIGSEMLILQRCAQLERR